MDLPGLRHFHNAGIYSIFSDPVEAFIDGAWMPAVYTDRGWATADGGSLLAGVQEWRHAAQAGQVAGCDLGEHPPRDQSGQVTQASRSNRVRKSRQKS